MRVRHSFSSRHNRKTKNIRKQKIKFPKQLEQVLENSDIVLEILDARFLDETRNKEVEREIKKSKKRIIFVLNKSDLVEKIPQRKLLSFIPYEIVSSRTRKGISKLRNKIKEISNKIKASEKNEGKIVVGVVGYPNTGKSSLINCLIGKNSAGTGHEAGFTKGIQKLKLSEKIILLDSPGVIPQKDYSTSDFKKISQHAKLSAKSYSQVKEPEIVVGNLMKTLPGIFEKYFKIKANGNSEILLEKLGKRKNFLKKKNEIDFDKTARFVLREWQEGEIKV